MYFQVSRIHRNQKDTTRWISLRALLPGNRWDCAHLVPQAATPPAGPKPPLTSQIPKWVNILNQERSGRAKHSWLALPGSLAFLCVCPQLESGSVIWQPHHDLWKHGGISLSTETLHIEQPRTLLLREACIQHPFSCPLALEFGWRSSTKGSN
jgi:hypothetical protein